MEDESNPWPSFVDTFSTVLCIFIFLMLVFALNNMIIMYDNSIKVYKANIEIINRIIVSEEENSQLEKIYGKVINRLLKKTKKDLKSIIEKIKSISESHFK